MANDTTEKTSAKWFKATKGIRYRLHPTRKHGKQPDRYYSIRYSVDGQRKEEGLGWLSEGWTLDKVQEQLLKLKSGIKTGDGPQSLADKRRIAKEKEEKAEKLRKEEARKGITLREFYTKHYEPWKSASKSVAFSKEASHWEHWLEPNLGDKPLRAIDLEQWHNFANILRQAKRSQRTVEYVCGTLRRILKHALQLRIITEAPPSEQQPPRITDGLGY